MIPGAENNAELTALGVAQRSVVHRRQFDGLDVHRSYVRNQIAARRWSAMGPNLVLLQNTAPTRAQLMWCAVLDAEGPAAVCSHTSLELAGMKAFAREADAIHLVVGRGARPTSIPGVVVHESRRLEVERWAASQGLPRTESPRSVVDAAAWQPWPRFACLMIAAAVQQGICTPDEIDQALGYVGRVRHKGYLRLALADVAGGAESLGEIDIGRVCERFGLVPPSRQTRRRDSMGRNRYLDCEWRLASGERVVLEVDGAHHMDAAHWQDDIRRERSLVRARYWVLRATAFEVRLEPRSVVADLIAVGVPRLVRVSEPNMVPKL